MRGSLLESRPVHGVCLGATVVATVARLAAPPLASPDVTVVSATVALVAWSLLVVLSTKRPVLSPTVILAAGTAVLLFAVARPPLGSHDLSSYAAYGRMLVHEHRNPYLTPPSAFLGDPVMRRVDVGWRPFPSVYGPLFTVVSAAVSAVAGTSALVSRLAFQGGAAAAVLVTAVHLARRGVGPGATAALVLHPVVVVTIVNGGHGDMVVGALLAASVWQMASRPCRSSLLAAAAACIKITAVAGVPVLAWWHWRAGRRRAAVETLLMTTVALAVGYLPFGGLRALRPLLSARSMVSRASLLHLLTTALPSSVSARSLALIPVAAVVILSLSMWLRHRRESLGVNVLAVLAGYLFAANYVLPWYFGWALPLASGTWSSRLAKVIVAYSAAVFAAYEYRVEVHPDRLDLLLRATVGTAEVAGLALIVVALWPGANRAVRRSLDHPLA